MIVSVNPHPPLSEFQKLMFQTDRLLNADALKRPKYYATRGGNPLEDDVKEALVESAKGTAFENTIEKISGQRFPDIIAAKYYGVEVKADCYADGLRIEQGRYVFDYHGRGVDIEGLILGIPGRLNVENATAAITLALEAGVQPEEIRRALPDFKGVARRFNIQVYTEKTIYIDDYAHHPREIEASLSSIREMWPDKRLTVAFQPHLYSRTNDFYPEFAKSLNLADQVILLDIYPAREQPIPGVTSGLIAERLTVPFVRVTKEEFPEYVKENVKEGVFMTVGAGDIDRFIPIFTEMFGGTDC